MKDDEPPALEDSEPPVTSPDGHLRVVVSPNKASVGEWGMYIPALFGGMGSFALLPAGWRRTLGVLLFLSAAAIPLLMRRSTRSTKPQRAAVIGLVASVLLFILLLSIPSGVDASGSSENSSHAGSAGARRGSSVDRVPALAILHPTATRDTNIWIAEAEADGRLTEPVRRRAAALEYGIDPEKSQATFGDVNHDDNADITFAQYSDSKLKVWLMQADSHGSFLAPELVLEIDNKSSIKGREEFRLLNGDFTGDGRADLFLLELREFETGWRLVSDAYRTRTFPNVASGTLPIINKLAPQGSPAVGRFTRGGRDSIATISADAQGRTCLVFLQFVNEGKVILLPGAMPVASGSLIVGGNFKGIDVDQVYIASQGDSHIEGAIVRSGDAGGVESALEKVGVLNLGGSEDLKIRNVKLVAGGWGTLGSCRIAVLYQEPDDSVRVFQGVVDSSPLTLAFELTRESVGWHWSLSTPGALNA